MAKHFGQIFWSLILATAKVKFNDFTIIPESISYALVAVGCGGLAGVSKRFGTARTSSWILAVLFLPKLEPHDHLPAFYEFATAVLEGAAVWFILGGIMDLAGIRQRPDLLQRASNRRLALALACVMLLIGLLSDGRQSPAIADVFVLLGICLVILDIMILYLVYRVRRELA